MAKTSAPDASSDEPTRDAGRWADRGVVPRSGGRSAWVLVADEAIARFLASNPDVPGELQPLPALTDPAAHAREGELHTNEGGRRAGAVGGQGAGPRTGAGSSVVASAGLEDKHLEARAFAKRVAARLSEAHRQKQFDELTLMAAPRFLGLLRQELDQSVRAVVVHELDKDLIHASDADIASRWQALGRA